MPFHSGDLNASLTPHFLNAPQLRNYNASVLEIGRRTLWLNGMAQCFHSLLGLHWTLQVVRKTSLKVLLVNLRQITSTLISWGSSDLTPVCYLPFPVYFWCRAPGTLQRWQVGNFSQEIPTSDIDCNAALDHDRIFAYIQVDKNVLPVPDVGSAGRKAHRTKSAGFLMVAAVTLPKLNTKVEANLQIFFTARTKCNLFCILSSTLPGPGSLGDLDLFFKSVLCFTVASQVLHCWISEAPFQVFQVWGMSSAPLRDVLSSTSVSFKLVQLT